MMNLIEQKTKKKDIGLLLISIALAGSSLLTTFGRAGSGHGLVAAPEFTGPAAKLRWSGAVLQQKSEWYDSAEARAIADSVLQYQSPEGGWPKSTDLAVAPRTPEDIPPPGRGRANSIDNDATTLPMQFLALVVQATGEARYRKAFERGVDYLLAAQYPNGGWPQFFPLRGEYYSRITYNDDAMVRVLTVLRDAAAGHPPYDFVDAARRAKAVAAVARGIDCILRTQVKQDGKLTVWCAQHDEKTLKPAWARTYEPPSLSGSESVGVVRFLMSIEKPTPEIIAAVEGAVAWLQAVVIKGVRIERILGPDGRTERRLVADPAAQPLWARFYEIGTNRPLYLDRDSVFHYAYAEVGYERRSGYDYHGAWAASLLAQDYPRWRAKHFEQELPMRGGLGLAQQGLLNRPRELTPESLGMLRAISPVNHVRPGLPPFLLLYGDADKSVPYQQSLNFQAKLQANGVRCDLITLRGAPHRLTERDKSMPDYCVRVIARLRETLAAPGDFDSIDSPTADH